MGIVPGVKPAQNMQIATVTFFEKVIFDGCEKNPALVRLGLRHFTQQQADGPRVIRRPPAAGGGPSRHCALTRDGGNQSLLAQKPQRLAQGGAADLQLSAQLPFGRQAVAPDAPA